MKTLRICPKGHKYYKSSDCPTCPKCKEAKNLKEGFLSMVSAPARRALENAEITTLIKLSKWREYDLLKLHGIGPSAIPKLKEALKQKGLKFKK